MKAEVDQLHINKHVNVQVSLNNFKAKVVDLDAGKLKSVPVELKKLCDVVDNEVVKNKKFNTVEAKVVV